jgi:hypothetical protein
MQCSRAALTNPFGFEVDISALRQGRAAVLLFPID